MTNVKAMGNTTQVVNGQRTFLLKPGNDGNPYSWLALDQIPKRDGSWQVFTEEILLVGGSECIMGCATKGMIHIVHSMRETYGNLCLGNTLMQLFLQENRY
jgi:hypothetical protein